MNSRGADTGPAVLAMAAMRGQKFVLRVCSVVGQKRDQLWIRVCYEPPVDPPFEPMKHLYNLDINLHGCRIAAGRNNLLPGADWRIFFGNCWTAEGMSPVHTTSGRAGPSVNGRLRRYPRRDHRRPQERRVAVTAWAGCRPIWTLERYPLATALALRNAKAPVLAR